MRTVNEEVPLEPKGDKTADTYVVNQGPKGGYFFTKLKLLLLILLFVILIIIIIILAALLGAERAKQRVKDDGPGGSIAKEKGPGNSTTSAPSTAPPIGAWSNIRLPEYILPIHYDLHMMIDPNKDGFSGSEEIIVNITKETPTLLLHSNGLDVNDVKIKNSKKVTSAVKNHFDFPKNHYHVIKTADSLVPGIYVLELKFNGTYSKTLFGLFKGTYRRKDNKEVSFVSMQFEPLDARTMFPCFDEPAMKATFSVDITHPKEMMALSNNIVRENKEDGSLRTTFFKKTPVMQTYLVSIAVGHFESKSTTSKNGVKIRAFAQPGKTDQMDFALEMANETLNQLEEVFGIPYPMTKLDLVAPPECYIAMENWGSIRFEEDGLLYKKGFSSEEIQQNLLMRWLPHEIAHMWFGNLVTMKWWDDLWLNEALADYFNYFNGSPVSARSWRRDVLFLHTNLGDALYLDGLVNSRPVIEPVSQPTIDTFDDIVYKKGSSLLNMLKTTLPHKDNFITGMRKYLQQHSYGNTVGDDMWAALQSVCPANGCENIKETMTPWMTKTGYPVLTIEKSNTPNKYIVTQEHFLYDKTAKPHDSIWSIDFTYNTSPSKSSVKPSSTKSKWIKTVKQVEIDWDGNGWIKGNVDQTGFYRVNYDDQIWTNLAEQLQHSHVVFSEADRYGLIDDAFNLARGQRLNITKALDMTNYLTNEKDYLPWTCVQKNIGYIQSILPHHSHTYHHLKRYMAFQSEKLFNDLGIKDGGSHLDKLKRLIVAGFQCDLGTKDCLGNMTMMFREWKKNPLTTSITPALRKLVYYYGVHQGIPEDWEQVLNELKKTTIPSEIQPLLMGLAGSRDTWTLYKYIKMMGDQNIVKKQYAKYVLDYVANYNPDGPDVAWTFLQLNWNEIKENGGPIQAMITYLPTITKRFSTPYQLEQLTNFIDKNLKGEDMPRYLRKAVEVVRLNIAWRTAHEVDLEKWLKDFLAKQNLPAEKFQSFDGFSEPA